VWVIPAQGLVPHSESVLSRFPKLAVLMVCYANLFIVSCHLCSAAPRRVIGAAAEVSQPQQSAVGFDAEGGAEASLEAAPHVTHESQVLEPLQSAVCLYGADPREVMSCVNESRSVNGIASAA